MSYRCEICQGLCPPGAPRRFWTVFREREEKRRVLDKAMSTRMERPYYTEVIGMRKERARELAVCKQCLELLEGGVPLEEVIALYAPQSPVKDMLAPVSAGLRCSGRKYLV